MDTYFFSSSLLRAPGFALAPAPNTCFRGVKRDQSETSLPGWSSLSRYVAQTRAWGTMMGGEVRSQVSAEGPLE